MKRLLVLVLLVLGMGLVQAQEEAPEYVLRVMVDSAFLRVLPDPESEAIASVFEDDSLLAVGRNADGTWLQVRRPGRTVNAGWIAKGLVGFTFEVARLPITDLTTGVTGPEAVFDSGVSIYILTEAALRAGPVLDAERVGVVPVGLTVPVFERSRDSLWLHVNYLGTTGWVAEFLTRTTDPIADLPVTDMGAPLAALEIIPPEVQLAQARRLREFTETLQGTSETLANFWSLVARGGTIPCDPPGGLFAYYAYSQRDIYELPELRQEIRRLPRAIDDLNASIVTMQRCGVYTAEEISTAYAQAINARSIVNGIITRMNRLETTLNAQIG